METDGEASMTRVLSALAVPGGRRRHARGLVMNKIGEVL